MKRIRRILKHLFLPHRGNAFRPHALRHGALSFYLLLIMTVQVGLGVTLYSGPQVKGADTETLKQNILLLTNKERQRAGQGELYENRALDKAAAAKLDNMFKENYWDHVGPNGETAWDFIGDQEYQYEVAGENLARGFSSSSDVVRAWMASPTHKQNILNNRFQEIGLAIGSGKIHGSTTTVIVQLFGRPKTAFAAENTRGALNTNQTLLPEVSLENVTLPSRAPYFAIWSLIFGLIVVDGVMLRKLGLHTSPKHLYGFRTALAMSLLMLVLLTVGFTAIV